MPEHNLDRLPRNIRAKIRLEPYSGCWTWLGTFIPSKRRYRPRYVTDDFDNAGRDSTGYFATDRGQPMVRSPEKGYAVPAQRHVWSLLYGMPLADVPKLLRCQNERCVCPDHHTPTGNVPRIRTGVQRIVEASMDAGPGAASNILTGPVGPLSEEQIFAALERADVSIYIEMEDAAALAGLDPSQLKLQTWIRYIETHPQDDDELD